MQHHIYRCEWSPEQKRLLDQLREKIAKQGPGVTIIGNRLTIRWTDPKTNNLVEVHSLIDYVEDGQEPSGEDVDRVMNERRMRSPQ